MLEDLEEMVQQVQLMEHQLLEQVEVVEDYITQDQDVVVQVVQVAAVMVAKEPQDVQEP